MRASIRLARPIQNLIVSLLAVALFSAPASAKDQQPIKESIVINAPPETVFNIIRKQRNSNEMHRHQKSFDGKVAVIDENMEGVTVYGKVHCVWQETEQPYTRIDFKMLESDKFKSGFGSWILTPSQDGNQTTLEFDNFLDSGLKIPFAGQITKMAAHGDAKKRLEHIKEVAEAETRKESSK